MVDHREGVARIGQGRRAVAGVVAALVATAQLGAVSAAWAGSESDKPAGAATSPAPSPSPAELAAAKKHYAEGEKQYKAGDYAAALPEFKAANEVKATPQAERYIGLCEDQLGHPASAAEWFDEFLAHVPDKLAAQGDEVRKRVAEIKAMPGKVHLVSSPAGAEVTIDDKPQASLTPLDGELPPGPHKLKLTAAGRQPADKAIDVTFASTQTVTVELEPAPPLPSPRRPLRQRRPRSRPLPRPHLLLPSGARCPHT